MMSTSSAVMVCPAYLLFNLVIIHSGGQDLGQPHYVTSVSDQANFPEEKEDNEIHEETERNTPNDDLTNSWYRLWRPKKTNEHTSESRLVRETYETSPCVISTLDFEVTVNCSYLSLYSLSPSWFPSNTNKLFLEGNFLTTVKNFSFRHLSRLTYLSLRDNRINCTEANAFEGLGNLQVLDLYNNTLDLADKCVPEEIFAPLKNLKKLNLVQNIESKGHAKEFFRPLINLESLIVKVDGDYMQFGPEFRHLTKLYFLTATGNVRYITDSTFENLASLKELFLEDMVYLINMSKNTFLPLLNLSSLRMRHVQVDFHQALTLLHVFQGRNMSVINFYTVSWSFSKQDIKTYGSLTSHDTHYLTTICVQSLILNDTNIFEIEPTAFNDLTLWDKCLENLQISENPIIGQFTAFMKLFRLKSLRTIVLSDLERQCYNYFASDISFASNTLDDYGRFRRSSLDHLVGKASSDHHTNNTKKLFLSSTLAVISSSVRSITAVRFIGSQSLSSKLNLKGAENVEYIDMSENGFVEFYGVIEGLPSLKTLLLRGNDVSQISEYFFDSFPALEDLNLANCRLDAVSMATNSARLFTKLMYLKSLDLSTNSLYLLSPGTFSVNSTNLQHLILAQNQFKKVPFMLSDTPSLTELDLTYNALTYLDKTTTEALDVLALKPNGFTLRLFGNVLSCGCQNLQFLQWMMQTKVRFDQDGNFTCINRDGRHVYTASFYDLDALWRECVGEVFFAAALILLCVYVIGFLSVFLILKHKTLIRSTVLQLLGGFKLHTKEDYDIGVYIGYADTDYHFPCTRLREYIEDQLQMSTYISHRDLLPSCYKASAIVDAINSSWRILLICSPSFLEDDQWSMFVIRSAIYSQSPANPARVLVLVQEQCVHQLPTDLLASVSEDRIIVVDKLEMDYRLREKLRTRLHG